MGGAGSPGWGNHAGLEDDRDLGPQCLVANGELSRRPLGWEWGLNSLRSVRAEEGPRKVWSAPGRCGWLRALWAIRNKYLVSSLVPGSQL